MPDVTQDLEHDDDENEEDYLSLVTQFNAMRTLGCMLHAHDATSMLSGPSLLALAEANWWLLGHETAASSANENGDEDGSTSRRNELSDVREGGGGVREGGCQDTRSAEG